jgi:hypothetical protein
MKRRGLFAALAGLVAAIVTKPKPVAATSGGGLDGNLVIGSTFLSPNTGNSVTVLTPGGGNFNQSILAEFVASVSGGTAVNVNGLFGQGRGTGSGVIGVTGFATGNGGNHSGSFANSGVIGYGSGTAVGVQGISAANFGVFGRGGPESVGVYGIGPYVGTVGFGQNPSAIGVWGQTTGTSGYAVFGRALTAGGIGVWGEGTPWAGVFSGGVYVNGPLTVSGAKSAAVPHPDGSMRRLYCVESPESWFEDFGRGTMVDGRACVTLDPDFAAVVHSEAYHVFLTPNGESNGLYVDRQMPDRFEVREQQNGSSALTFSYRVVARRKDIDGPRLERIDKPDFAAADRLKPIDVPERPEEPAPSPETGRK